MSIIEKIYITLIEIQLTSLWINYQFWVALFHLNQKFFGRE